MPIAIQMKYRRNSKVAGIIAMQMAILAALGKVNGQQNPQQTQQLINRPEIRQMTITPVY